MKVKQIISENKSKNRMEVIAEEDRTLKTLHIRKENSIWKYFVGCNEKDTKVYASIIMQ